MSHDTLFYTLASVTIAMNNSSFQVKATCPKLFSLTCLNIGSKDYIFEFYDMLLQILWAQLSDG